MIVFPREKDELPSSGFSTAFLLVEECTQSNFLPTPAIYANAIEKFIRTLTAHCVWRCVQRWLLCFCSISLQKKTKET